MSRAKFFLIALLLLMLVGAMGATFVFGHKKGAGSVQAEWDAAELKRKKDEQEALIARIAENGEIAKKHEAEKALLRKGYNDEIAQIRRDASTAGRLRVSANLCREFALSSHTDGTAGSDAGATGTWLLPEVYSRDIGALMLEADEIVASCRVAQNFLIQYGMD